MAENKSEVRETARLEAFSDGVIAIAITLLALEIHVPPVDADVPLLVALTEQWPMYLAFLLSFATIGIMWMNHHRMFTLIKRTDHIFLILNTLLLMGMTLVPFTSALLGEYLGHEGEVLAAVIYNGLFMLIAVVFNAMWIYAVRKQWLSQEGADLELAGIINRQYRFGPLYYLAALLAAALGSVAISIGINILLALFFALPAEVVRRILAGSKPQG
jgi:uncharacterized membrane protein